MMELSRLATLFAFSSIALVPPADAAPQVRASESMEDATRFLESFRTGDEAQQLAALRSVRSDPFLVADVLLFRHARAIAGGAEGETEDLRAALAYAALAGRTFAMYRGLPDYVRPWAPLDRAALERRASYALRTGELRQALRNGTLDPRDPSVLAAIADAAERDVSLALLCWEQGEVLRRAKRHREAEEAYVRCGEIAAELRWHRMSGDAYYYAGELANLAGEPRRAVVPFERGIEQNEVGGNPYAVMRMRTNLAVALAQLGDRDGCWEQFEAAHEFAQSAQDHTLEAHILAQKANLLADLGRYGAALDHCLEALTFHERFRLQPALDRGETVRMAGLMHVKLGRIAEGLVFLERARKLHQQARKLVELSRDLLALAAAYVELDQRDAADELFALAVEAAEQGPDRRQVASARLELGLAQIDHGDARAGLDAVQSAILDFTEVEARDAARDARARAADARIAHGEAEEVLPALEELFDEASRQSPAEALSLRLALARAHWAMDSVEKAVAQWTSARAEALRFESPGPCAEACEGLARAASHGKRWSDASRFAREAVENRHRLSAGLGGSHAEAVHGAARSGCDLGLFAIAAELASAPNAAATPEATTLEATRAKTDDALFFAESARALALAEEVAERAALRESRLSPELADQDAFSRRRLSDCHRELVRCSADARTTAEQIEAATAELHAALRAHDEIVARAQRESRLAGALLYAPPLGRAELQAGLAERDALVLYHVAGERLFALVARKNALSLHDLGAWLQVRRLAEAWREQIATPDAALANAERKNALALDAVLLAPLRPALESAHTLRISPDDVLSYLPFEALLAERAGTAVRAIEEREIVYVPSATVDALARRSEVANVRSAGLLALADPIYPSEQAAASEALALARSSATRDFGDLVRLPSTAVEVSELASAFSERLPGEPRVVLQRAEASLQALRSALATDAQPRRWRIAHFACHGCFHPAWPRLTGLVLSGGEVLNAPELLRLRLEADLAMFSGCETAKGELKRGEGLVGLVRAAMATGCARVLVTRWKIDDAGTRDFVQRFYAQHLAGGLAPSAALRAARLQCLKSGGPLAQPYHWAAFALWGRSD